MPRPSVGEGVAGEQRNVVFSDDKTLFYPLLILMLFYVILMIKTAWLGDDAYISFRPLDNLLHGYGLRWNIAERVQVYTDPLWLVPVFIAYAITREFFVTVLVLSIIVSFTAVFLVIRRMSSSVAAAVFGMVALISSRAFLDYSTSGLENTMSYLLVACFCIALVRTDSPLQRFRYLTLIGSLGAVNRLDLVLIFGPGILEAAWLTWRTRETTLLRFLRDAIIYSVPLWGWLIFSTIYFGFIFPNTYYAKLYTALPPGQVLTQGILYYVNSLEWDPVTLVAIAFSLVAVASSRNPRLIAAILGVVLYLLYIVEIGGDFMSGRFFTVPLLLCIGLLLHLRMPRRTWLVLAVLFLGVGLLARNPSLSANERFGSEMSWIFGTDPPANSVADGRGIADERAAYYPVAGLLPVLRHDRAEPLHSWVTSGKEARERRQIVSFETPGFFGYYAGPDVHILDSYALGDPLLSKLPSRGEKTWRIGHFKRLVPNGYLETLQTGVNSIEDPEIRELYDSIRILTRDPIWSWGRFREIAKMNFGFYTKTIKSIDLSHCSPAPPIGASFPWADPVRGFQNPGPVFATIKAKWSREPGENGAHWWTDRQTTFSFSLPDPFDPQAPMIIPVQPYVAGVQLHYTVNGEEVLPEVLPVKHSFIPMRLKGPWRKGENIVEVVGTGEPAQPPGGHDPRRLLFATREPRWEGKRHRPKP